MSEYHRLPCRFALLTHVVACALTVSALISSPCCDVSASDRQTFRDRILEDLESYCEDEGLTPLNDSTDLAVRGELLLLNDLMQRLAVCTRYPSPKKWQLYYFEGDAGPASVGGGVIMMSRGFYRQYQNDKSILAFVLAHEMCHDLADIVCARQPSAKYSFNPTKFFQNREILLRAKRAERYADTGATMLLPRVGFDRYAGVRWFKQHASTTDKVLGYLVRVRTFDEHGRLTATRDEYCHSLFDHGTYQERLDWLQAAADATWRSSGLPKPYFVGLNDDLTYDQAIITRYDGAGGAPQVGYPFDRNSSVFVHKWRDLLIQDFLRADGESGAIVRKEGSTNAWWVHGAIWATFASKGGPASFGAPLEDEQGHPDGSGDQYQHFEKATFLWHRATGVTEVLGPGWKPDQPRRNDTSKTPAGGEAATPSEYSAFFAPLSYDNGIYNIRGESGTCEYVDGWFRITGRRLIVNRGHRFADGLAQIETEYIAGQPEDAYGLVFRFSDRAGSGRYASYEVGIGNVGGWVLGRHDGSGPMVILESGMSEAIRTGPRARNTVAVICAGPRIQVLVNGTKVGEVMDSTYADGLVGPFSACADGVISFRNLRVDPTYARAPTPSEGQTDAGVPNVAGTWTGRGGRKDGRYGCQVTMVIAQAAGGMVSGRTYYQGDTGWTIDAQWSGSVTPEGTFMTTLGPWSSEGGSFDPGTGRSQLQPDGTIVLRGESPRSIGYVLRRTEASGVTAPGPRHEIYQGSELPPE